ARTPVRAVAAAPAPAAPPVTEVAFVEPQPERIARFAGEEGTTTMAVGVVLRGGAVGDDKCERELPRARPATAAVYRPAAVRLGGVPTGPRHGPGSMPYVPRF
ncbi:hypothetical protein PYV61_26085, partial [Roseisolibacter sp. H3M3-2]